MSCDQQPVAIVMNEADRSEPIDPLSEALSAMHMESSLLGIFTLAAPWAFDHPHLGGVVCHIVAEGRCFWIPAEGPSVQLDKGDLIAFPYGDPHRFASDPGLKGVPIEPLLTAIGHPLWTPRRRYSRPLRYSADGPGERTVIIDLISAFPDPKRNPLLRALPRVFHIPAKELQILGCLEFLLGILASESPQHVSGYAAAVSRIADLMFIQAVRTYMCIHAADVRGWLRGLLHPRISRALQAIHMAPERNWTVAQLATEAGMSRTLFAQEFCACLEQTPIHYLTEWRMHLALQRLAAGDPVNVVSDHLGYASPVSFARTFRRIVGVAPGNYRRIATIESSTDTKGPERKRMTDGSASVHTGTSDSDPMPNEPDRMCALRHTDRP
jgi:AraC-like DNA-binding protein